MEQFSTTINLFDSTKSCVSHRTISFRGYTQPFDEDRSEDVPIVHEVSRAWSVYAKIGIGRAHADGRRRVSISLYVGMTPDTSTDSALLGSAIDEGNEAEVWYDRPTFFKFRAQESLQSDDAKCTFPGATLIAEMDPVYVNIIRFYLQTDIPLAAVSDVQHFNRTYTSDTVFLDSSLVPGVPSDRPTPCKRARRQGPELPK